ncbi:hypothetical protein ACFY0P_03840 [Streptomyces sp. NPDC001714]|uniref:hypothetical protein n=1 Tax=Streptomyces sp. NPDC001714 TaxID=3364603 RepID=UPI0036C42D04
MLIIVGGQQKHSLRGKAARDILPLILGELTKGNDPYRLCDDEDTITTRQMDAILALLEARDLLEDAGSAPDATPDDVAVYFSRMLSEIGGYSGSAEITSRLARAAVVLIGKGAVTEAIHEDLRYLGTGVCQVGDPSEIVQAYAAFGDSVSVLAVIVDDGSSALGEAERHCVPLGLPLLRVACSGDTFEIGPVLDAGTSACAACVGRSRAEAGWDRRTDDGPGQEFSSDILAGLAASEIVAVLLKSAKAAVPRTVTVVSAEPRRTTESFLVVPYPDCRDCGSGVIGGPAPNMFDAYDWAMSAPAPHLARGKKLSRAQATKLKGATDRRAPFRTHPRIPLPATREMPLPAGPDRATSAGPMRIGEDEISLILNRSAGFQGGAGLERRDRHTPSGGNFGSTSLLCVTEQVDFGVCGTVFRYADFEHELILQHPDPVPVAELVGHTGLAHGTFDAVVILVAQQARLAQKYGEFFSYRLSLLDAGCATTQIAAMCDALGIEIEISPEWDDEVATLLGLDVGYEFIAGIIGLRSRRTAPCH